MAIFSTGGSGDDANEVVSSGVMNTTGDGTVAAVSRFDGTNHGGFRFAGVTIANGATINNATLKFDQLSFYSSNGAAVSNTTLYGQNADNPINFGVGASDISARARTTANTTGSNLLDTVTAAQTNGYDVAAIVQEIVNRAGWVSGNAMVMLFIGTGTSGSNYIQPYMWDYFSGFYFARLEINKIVPKFPPMVNKRQAINRSASY